MSTDSRRPVPVHMICQAHIDPIWIWDWPEGLTETLSTFETAADLLDEYPEFVFNHNESALYEWTKHNRRELFDRIRAHVRSGRWVISGGWYLQPDMNLPSGESIARQILIGRRFFMEEFGVEPTVACNLDTFGHNANTPQFLKLSGYSMYTHFRPMPWEMQLPDFLYTWRGVDGSEVTGFRPPCGWYCTHPGSLVENKIDRMRDLAAERDRPTTMFWGAGDHGGGATRADLELIRKVAQDRPKIVHSSLERYRSEVVAGLAPELPVVTGELQKCFTGCYTSVIGNKARNRRGEGLALAAERWSALAWWLLDEPYPAKKLSRVWKDVLFTQFHDVLPGTSIRDGAISAAEMTGRAATEAREVLIRAQLELMRKDRAADPLTVRVFNPYPVRRTVPAVVDVQLATHPYFVREKYLALYDAAGNEISRQLLGYLRNTGDWRNTILFEADLPPLGLAEFRIRIEDHKRRAAEERSDSREGPAEPEDPDAFLHVDGRRLHDESCRVAERTEWFRMDHDTITVDTGDYSARVSRAGGALLSLATPDYEFIAAPSGRILVRADSNDAWGGSQPAYGPVVGEFSPPDDDELSEITGQYGERTPAPPVRIAASGPLAVVVESITRYKRSVARLRYTIYRHHRYLDVDLLLDWNERRRCAQWELATTLPGPDYDAEIPHAAVNRARGGGEEPMGRWIMLSRRGRSFALVNNAPAGAEVEGAKIRQTLVRSPVYSSGNSSVEPGFLGEHMDIGEHLYRFRVLFGPTDAVVAERQLAADDLTLPFSYHCSVPPAASDRPGLDPGAATISIARCGGEGRVHLEALKVSEDGEALVLRLAERSGDEARVRITAPGIEPLECGFGLYEMKTFRAEKPRGRSSISVWRECDLIERPIE